MEVKIYYGMCVLYIVRVRVFILNLKIKNYYFFSFYILLIFIKKLIVFFVLLSSSFLFVVGMNELWSLKHYILKNIESKIVVKTLTPNL